jgi:hypothetical protein
MPKRYVLLTLSIPEEEMDLAMGILGGYPLLGVEQGLDECTVCFEQNDWQQDYADAIVAELGSVHCRAAGGVREETRVRVEGMRAEARARAAGVRADA